MEYIIHPKESKKCKVGDYKEIGIDGIFLLADCVPHKETIDASSDMKMRDEICEIALHYALEEIMNISKNLSERIKKDMNETKITKEDALLFNVNIFNHLFNKYIPNIIRDTYTRVNEVLIKYNQQNHIDYHTTLDLLLIHHKYIFGGHIGDNVICSFGNNEILKKHTLNHSFSNFLLKYIGGEHPNKIYSKLFRENTYPDIFFETLTERDIYLMMEHEAFINEIHILDLMSKHHSLKEKADMINKKVSKEHSILLIQF